jgi:tetratricopeptide (TPR) repeat protein
VIGRLAMYVGPSDFLRFLRESVKPGESLAAVDKRIDDGDRSPELLMRSADRHYEAGDFEIAEKRYKETIAAAPRSRASGRGREARSGARARDARRQGPARSSSTGRCCDPTPSSKRLSEAFVSALFLLREDKEDGRDRLAVQGLRGRFPDEPRGANDYARHLLETGRRSGARGRGSRRAPRASTPRSADYEATHARALLAAKRPDEAMQAAMKALSLRPTDKELWAAPMEVQDAQRAAAVLSLFRGRLPRDRRARRRRQGLGIRRLEGASTVELPRRRHQALNLRGRALQRGNSGSASATSAARSRSRSPMKAVSMHWMSCGGFS